MIAKSNPVETIDEHTGHLLEGFEYLKNLYGDRFSDNELQLIKLAAVYHDCGKSNFNFQKMIRKKANISFSEDELKFEKDIEKMYKSINNGESVPHGFLSPAFLNLSELESEFCKEDIRILINAIYFHHTRDYSFTDREIKNMVDEDLKKRLKVNLQSRYFGKVYINQKPIEDSEWIKFAVVKGILNKLDYWASSDRRVPIEIKPDINDKYIGDVVEQKIDTCNLRDVQIYMKNNQNENLVVIASTGIGKTEAALLWIGDYKAFYTLPLKVSINAIYERINKEYGCPKDKLALLHSDSFNYLLEKENELSTEKNNLTRKLAFPLTICTVDQLFTFVYKYRGSEILLANLKYSKLIIDEIQAYSPEIIGKLVYGLKLITDAGGKFSIITATMPPIFEYYLNKQKINYIKPQQVYYSPHKNRHLISLKSGDFEYSDIVKNSKSKKVLIICNTVRKAQETYENLKGSNVFLLHSKYIQKHRHLLEDKIMDFTSKNNNNVGIWITTQIVEASLDLDFDILYTEMCTADSLLQRMGRCYRKRDYLEQDPNIIIYDTRNGVGKEPGKGVYDSYLYDRSLCYLKKYSDRLFKEEDKIDYINDVYSTQDLINEKFSGRIEKAILECRNIVPGLYDEKEAKQKFRDISSVSLIPDSIFNKINTGGYFDNLIAGLQNKYSAERTKAESELKSYTVSIPGNTNKRDKKPICGNVVIYRTSLKYEFDEKTLEGRGLLNEEESDNFI